MKLLRTLLVFGTGAAVGYLLASNRVELNVSIDPIVDKVKNTLSGVMNQGGCTCESECDCETECADESCEHEPGDCSCDDVHEAPESGEHMPA